MVYVYKYCDNLSTGCGVLINEFACMHIVRHAVEPTIMWIFLPAPASTVSHFPADDNPPHAVEPDFVPVATSGSLPEVCVTAPGVTDYPLYEGAEVSRATPLTH